MNIYIKAITATVAIVWTTLAFINWDYAWMLEMGDWRPAIRLVFLSSMCLMYTFFIGFSFEEWDKK